MGQTLTTNYSLIKPNEFENDDIWGGQLNLNADAIDAQMKTNANGVANSQPLDGDLTAIAAIGNTHGFLTKTGTNTWVIDTGNYQPLDADLTAIGALTGTSGVLRKTAANTWELTANYADITTANVFQASQEAVSTTAAAASLNPTWDTFRNRATVTDADLLGGFMAYGNTVALVKTLFGRIYHKMVSAALGAEASQWIFDTYINGGRNQGVLRLAAGAMIGNTVLDPGVGGLNAELIYESGLRLKSQTDSTTASGAAIDVAAAWVGKIAQITSGGSVPVTTITIQPNATIAIPNKTFIDITWTGATPSILIAPGAGVTLNSLNGWRTMIGRYGRVRLYQTSTDTWYMSGDLKA